MRRLTALFSFRGRASRRTYWRLGLATGALWTALWVVAMFVVMRAGIVSTILLSLILPVMAVNLAVCARRLHDQDKSGWWLLILWAAPLALLRLTRWLIHQPGEGGRTALATSLAALGLELWALVEIGFRSGTPGPNRFGPQPISGPRRRQPTSA